MKRLFASILLVFATAALAISPADKAALQNQAALAVQQAQSLKAMIDLLPLDVVIPPPVVAWPRIKPNMLDLDLVDLDPVDTGKYPLTGKHGFYGASPNPVFLAKWLDGNPGFDGLGTAIHYGSMSGGVIWQYNVDGTANHDWNNKFTNGSCSPAKWGVESNGLHYLETCTDGTKEPVPQYGCATCRMINWGFATLPVKEIWWRNMEYIYPATLTYTTDLGIKGSGVGGTLIGGGTFAEIQEYGDKTKDVTHTGFPGQWYRYDIEGAQGVTSFGGFTYVPGKWYTNEGHVKVPTCATCADGVLEFKVDGVLVYSNKVARMGAAFVTGFSSQLYHGGQMKPSGILRFKIARIALSTAGWIGPAQEVVAP